MVVPVYFFQFLIFTHLSLLLYAPNVTGNSKCPHSFDCGNLGSIRYPFTTTERQDCGLLAIRGCSNPDPAAARDVQLTKSGKWFNVRRFEWEFHHKAIIIRDDVFSRRLESGSCEAFTNSLALPPSSPLASFQIERNITIFKCKSTLHVPTPKRFIRNTTICKGYDIYYGPSEGDETDISCFKNCSMIQLPLNWMPILQSQNPFDFLSDEIPIEVRLSPACIQCLHDGRGQCRLDSKERFFCAKGRSRVLKLELGLGLGVASFILITGLFLFWLYKRKHNSDVQFQPRNRYDDEYHNTDPDEESGRVLFAVPVFSYKELQEATDNFNLNRRLGDGGFGTVYYGKLQDGREVAVKRLYENSYRRVEQFMNEIEILTCMRHQNLVSLYGCTSHRSRELLLVYEYIPNGTVASHLHGGLARPSFLPWHIRMKIAIETASALAYLHACEIIHRDVKTNNILLDNNFCVKVADFGLSRLFPKDVTHISTAPQGTPGYLDPEYHQCYQLTSKSDVYSFGVVLIELISSLPVVDTSRHKDDINLANLAIRKIQKCEFSELVDPCLGFESNNDTKRLIVSVGELAFQCLQKDKELRPSMDEVLRMLKRIENGNKDELEEADVLHGAGVSHSCVQTPPPTSPDCEEFGLLRTSQNIMTDKWESKFTVRSVSF